MFCAELQAFIKGTVHNLLDSPLAFSGRKWHQSEPWHGDRWVITAYTCSRLGSFPAGDIDALRALNFPLPPQCLPQVSVPSSVPPPDAGPPPRTAAVEPQSRKPFALEIFCGSAGVSAAFRRVGIESLGVDHACPGSRAKSPMIRLDLRRKAHQDILWSEIQRADVVWLAPPCGTASRAREVPLKQKGLPRVRPLRDARYPEGFPWLTGVPAAKVQSANQLYAWAAEVFAYCLRTAKIVILENPANSWLWQTKWFKPLRPKAFWQVLHNCMYGSMRRKLTGLLSSIPLPGMQLTCNGKHSHLAWGAQNTKQGWTFSTAAETAYPVDFCRAVATDVLVALQERGFSFHHEGSPTAAAQAAMASNKQPRRGRGQVGPSEFASKVLLQVPVQSNLPPTMPATAPAGLQGVPVGSKLLWSREVLKGDCRVKECEYGIYHTPEAFLDKALQTVHPFDTPVCIDRPNLRAIAFTLENGVEATALRRKQVLEYYSKRKLELAEEEKKLKDSMHPDVRSVMESKNLLLFKEMLKDAEVHDEFLFDDMVSGFRVTGELRPSGQFPSKCKVAAITVDDLRATAKWAKHLVEASCRRAAKDKSVAKEVYAESLDQVDKGWLRGPFTWEQMDERHGGTWIPSKRFGVVQGDKVRSVDDLSEFLVNATVTETEKILLEGIDEITCLARYFGGATVAGVDSFRLPSSSKGTVTRRLHPDFRNGEARRLLGRALDLKAAYKQLAVHPADRWASVLAVLDVESDKVLYFESLALPFGATSAVTGFNRAGRALRMIMSRLLFLTNTSFFDDYCQMEVAPLAESADSSALELMSLLGWQVSTGDKLKNFSSTFNMLGATISFDELPKGFVNVSNKPGRIEDIEKLAKELEARGQKGIDVLPSLKGKLLYAAGHVFGKCAQIATQLIRHYESFGSKSADFESLCRAIWLAIRTLKEAGPRRISLWSEQPPIVIFSDGAHESDLVTHGAVIVDQATGFKEVFGDKVPDDVVTGWRKSGRRQLIFFAELFPVLVAKRTWADRLRNRRVLLFVDNQAAKSALIRGYSPLVDASKVLADIFELDVRLGCLTWVCWVPSKSNVADAASRLEFESYAGIFKRVMPRYAETS